jgi:uncharacterized DUF497 family protein
MNLRFEWDTHKALLNRMKHGVSFEEAVTVFADPLARIFDDPDHSITEAREVILGWSQNHRLPLVCFTERGDNVRIISARKTSKLERQDHEETRPS